MNNLLAYCAKYVHKTMHKRVDVYTQIVRSVATKLHNSASIHSRPQLSTANYTTPTHNFPHYFWSGETDVGRGVFHLYTQLTTMTTTYIKNID